MKRILLILLVLWGPQEVWVLFDLSDHLVPFDLCCLFGPYLSWPGSIICKWLNFL